MKGAHDDAIMSISMAMYAGDISFNQLQRNTAKNIAMMESWTMSERTYEPNRSFYSYGNTFDQIGSMNVGDNSYYGQNGHLKNTPNQYREYSWLFGKSK